jgi:predicted nuclease with RNAse H fold
LRRVLDLELEVRLAGFLLPALGAGMRGLVERLVELAAEFVDDRWLRLRLRERAG